MRDLLENELEFISGGWGAGSDNDGNVAIAAAAMAATEDRAVTEETAAMVVAAVPTARLKYH